MAKQGASMNYHYLQEPVKNVHGQVQVFMEQGWMIDGVGLTHFG